MKISVYNDFWGEEYSHFERVKPKAKARSFAEKAKTFKGHEKAKAAYKAERAKKETEFSMASSHEDYAA